MKIGLVLAGGGARGAYQIGVWKALKELNIDKYINVISGTSIGALNAVLIAKDDYGYAELVWNSLNKTELLPITEKEISIKNMILSIGSKNINFLKKYMPSLISGGSLSREGIYKFIDDIDFSCLKGNIVCYAACTQVPDIKAKYFKLSEYDNDIIRDILSATSAIPKIFDCVEIDGDCYLDGGIVDNVPIQPVYGEGCDFIIVVHLSKHTKIDLAKYPNTNIIEIIPSVMEDGDFEGVLDFNVDMSRKRIHIGYIDTINHLKPIIDLGIYINETLKNQKGGIFKRLGWIKK